VTPFPITPESFRRKVWRDLSGQTGIKQAILVYKRDMGFGRRRSPSGPRIRHCAVGTRLSGVSQ